MENMKEVVCKNFNEIMERNPQTTHREIAKTIKVNENSISRWRKGTSLPEMDNIEKLAEFFGVPWKTFFKTESTLRAEPVSVFAKRLLNVPDDVYKYAEDIGPNHSVWDTIVGLLEIESNEARAQKEASQA